MKPMQALREIPALDEINYPVIASPKIDGIRCVMVDGKPMSKSLKPIPNQFVNVILKSLELPEVDGELIVEGDFTRVSSAIMSREGCPDFKYIIFDNYKNPTEPYFKRFIQAVQANLLSDRIRYIDNRTIENKEQMEFWLNSWIELGYEGAIVRDPYGPYKFGRSTKKEGYMLKLKKFEDDEGEIIGFEELMHNENAQYTDEVGAMKRSTHQENQVPGDILGALTVKWNNVEFNLGSGFDFNQRYKLWKIKDSLIGRQVTFKYQGTLPSGKPRFPTFKTLRDE